MAQAHGLHDVTRAFLKKRFARIELFSEVNDREIDSLPQQMDLQKDLGPVQVMVDLTRLRSLREHLREQLEAFAAGGTTKEEVGTRRSQRPTSRT